MKISKFLKVMKNIKTSINYTTFGRSWNQIEIIVDDIFTYNIALDVLKDNKKLEPILVEECHHRRD
jgi:hypothetical protein